MGVLVKREPGGFSALWKSYAADWRGWVVRLAAGYGVAGALLVCGLVAVIAAVAVGGAAVFHFIELRFGADIAYAAVGGGLLAVGLILLLAGWMTLRRPAAPLPRPNRQVQAAKRMLVGSAMARTVVGLRRSEAAKLDTGTQVLLGSAAMMVVGWILASHLQSRRRNHAQYE